MPEIATGRSVAGGPETGVGRERNMEDVRASLSAQGPLDEGSRGDILPEQHGPVTLAAAAVAFTVGICVSAVVSGVVEIAAGG
ncbi:hypothetical protein AAH978_07090 [Streptomyces sp. ZYX-F-203]